MMNIQKRTKPTRRPFSQERLEQRMMLTAEISGLAISGSHWAASEFSPDTDGWIDVQLQDGSASDRIVKYSGMDRLRLSFTEPVVKGNEPSLLRLLSPEGDVVGEIGGDIAISSDGLSAVWQLSREVEAEFVAAFIASGSFDDADDSQDVVGLTRRLDVLPGDSDLNGVVDLKDFNALKDSFGDAGQLLSSDFTADGKVDLSDFNVLKANFSADVDPGATRDTAFVINSLAAPVSVSNEVGFLLADGERDSGDVYAFTLTQNARIDIAISEVTDSTYFWLYGPDANGDRQFGSDERLYDVLVENGSNGITQELSGGATYYVRVLPRQSNDNSAYQLAFSQKVLPGPVDPGSTRETALLVDIAAGAAYADVVTANVDTDVYAFTLEENARVQINIDGVTEATYFAIYGPDAVANHEFDRSERIGDNLLVNSGSNRIARDISGGGTYYLIVFPYVGGFSTNESNSAYQLTFSLL
ncbi:MAG: PPC domain-containing protein, partial [Planctomycetales bacterium]|nr:PPC domain-containing protein [Planctomycetales bacterium]